MTGLFNEFFDFNNDGKLDAFEAAAKFSTLNEFIFTDDQRSELYMADIDIDEFEEASVEEKRQMLIDAGLAPEDFL